MGNSGQISLDLSMNDQHLVHILSTKKLNFNHYKSEIFWIFQKEQANFLLKTGAIKGALDVYLRLEMWEDVIKCYKSLGQTEKVGEAWAQFVSCVYNRSLSTPNIFNSE